MLQQIQYIGPEALCFVIVCLLVSVCMHEYTPAQTGIPDCRLLVCVCVFCATSILVKQSVHCNCDLV